MERRNTDKFCVWWQGRRARSNHGRFVAVQKHGVFMRCSKSLDAAVRSTREVSKRRGSAAVTLQNEYGGGFTLMTCRKGRCRATHFGKKLGLKR